MKYRLKNNIICINEELAIMNIKYKDLYYEVLFSPESINNIKQYRWRIHKYGVNKDLLTVVTQIEVNGKKASLYLKDLFTKNKQYSLKFKNGNTLDFRLNNIEEYVRYGSNYSFHDDYAILYSSSGNEFIVDLEDVEDLIRFSWYKDDNGYACTLINNKKYFMSRIIMGKYYDITNKFIDHKNHEVWNNRKYNLRICDRRENNRNRSLHKNNSSNITGVYYHSKNNNWIAKININGKNKHLGSFSNKEDAIECRLEAEDKYYKDYSYKNSIKEEM